ncbi:Uu.00g041020.m01.CDS01 [Anthostomella pinea]|uniref:Uu.00g041020.m01.CDS01 n=1 Tax=Anthostomella pinea TaxID=933095 RepID=A0AAI8VA67_9PEZI|nr:Uu.00g041020.m01.CDS01 [Anthostomella pinea]
MTSWGFCACNYFCYTLSAAMMWPVFLILSAGQLACANHFYNPGSTMQVWNLGENQTIAWENNYTDFTNAIWLRGVPEDVRIGPILFQTAVDGHASSFNWTVQTYEPWFDEGVNSFFLWMSDGVDVKRQGGTSDNDGIAYMVSSDFNISRDTASTGGSTTTGATSSISATPSIPISTSTSSNPTSPTVIEKSSGLPDAAKAGIGASAAVAGVAIIACIFLSVWGHRRIKNRQATQGQATQGQQAGLGAGGQGYNGYPHQPYSASYVQTSTDYMPTLGSTPKPAEMDAVRNTAELESYH